MSSESQIEDLLERAFESGLAIEEVCRDAPELIEEVRTRLNKLKKLDGALAGLFPAAAAFKQIAVGPATKLSPPLPVMRGYEISGVLGRGGMGIVYRAKHIRLNRIVAIKMILAGPYATEADRRRFMREAEAVAALRHPNIVQIYDVGDVDNHSYISMEFVDGGSLAQRLSGVPLPIQSVASTITPLVEAVQSAHSQGIVHRDLKPANIMLASDGAPKITDFGLARKIGSEPALTQTGTRLGTPSYMAPEQIALGSDSIGPSADIYALGAVLYEMLTGRPPFRGETSSETERQVLSQDPVPPSRLNARVSRDLETICLKCLSKEPHRRYSAARLLLDDLRRFDRGEPITARQVGTLERGIRWAKRHPREVGLVAAVCALIVIAMVAAVRERNREMDRRTELANWRDRIGHLSALQEQGRYDEARAILGREVARSSDAIRARVESALSELDLVEQLDEIRMRRGRFSRGGGMNFGECDDAYATLFKDRGLGTMSEEPSTVAMRLRDSPVRAALVAALNDWSAVATNDKWPWLLAVARAVDPADPWRDQMRDLAIWTDIKRLAELAKVANVEKQPVSVLVSFGIHWRILGGDPTEFYQRAHHHHPDDLWLNFELGYLLAETNPAESVGYFRAAIALRPTAAEAHYNMGVHMFRADRYEEAIRCYQRAIACDPGHGHAHLNLAIIHERLGRPSDAEPHFKSSIVAEPLNPEPRFGLRSALVAQGRLREACIEWRQAVQLESATHRDWDGLAELCLYLDDPEEYHDVAEALLRRFESSEDPHICERVGRACLLLPPRNTEVLLRATALIDRASNADASLSEEWSQPYFRFAKALATLRSGDPEGALTLLSEEVQAVLKPAPELLVAISLHRAGHLDQARAQLAHAIESIEWSAGAATSREAWLNHILRREAEAVIGRESGRGAQTG